MHSMKYSHDDKIWTVGYFEPTDDGGENWYALEDFKSRGAAERYVNYLNGGTGELYPSTDE